MADGISADTGWHHWNVIIINTIVNKYTWTEQSDGKIVQKKICVIF
jgi:hypothetical protein